MNINKVLFLGAGSLVAVLAFGISRGIAQQAPEKPTPPINKSSDKPLVMTRTRNIDVSPEFIAQSKRISELEFEAKGLLKQQRWAEAEEKLKEVLEVRPNMIPAVVYAELAEAQYQQGDFQEALKSMKLAFYGPSKGLESSPGYVVRFVEIAERCGDSALVAELWEKAFPAALGGNSDIAEAANRAKTQNQKRALVLVAAGQEAEALSDYTRMKQLNLLAVQADPKCAVAHLNLGRLCGRTQESMTHLQAASKYGSPSLKLFADNSITTLRYYLNQKKK